MEGQIAVYCSEAQHAWIHLAAQGRLVGRHTEGNLVAKAAEYRLEGGGAVYPLTAPDTARDLLGTQEMGDLIRRLDGTR
jgi:hypothetical protein